MQLLVSFNTHIVLTTSFQLSFQFTVTNIIWVIIYCHKQPINASILQVTKGSQIKSFT